MCGLFFVSARVREARKRGWEISNFLGFLGIVGVEWSGLSESGSEFERERKIFGFLGFLEILG